MKFTRGTTVLPARGNSPSRTAVIADRSGAATAIEALLTEADLRLPDEGVGNPVSDQDRRRFGERRVDVVIQAGF